MTAPSSAGRVIALARDKNVRLATAESCSGGLLAAALTAVPGASTCFERGYVVYSNAAKIEVLTVDPDLIECHGAVSSQVAGAMATGALCALGANQTDSAGIAVAVTGIAGPSGGSAIKPTGTVYIAAQPGTLVQKHLFADHSRDQVRTASVRAALSMFEEILDRL